MKNLRKCEKLEASIDSKGVKIVKRTISDNVFSRHELKSPFSKKVVWAALTAQYIQWRWAREAQEKDHSKKVMKSNYKWVIFHLFSLAIVGNMQISFQKFSIWHFFFNFTKVNFKVNFSHSSHLLPLPKKRSVRVRESNSYAHRIFMW